MKAVSVTISGAASFTFENSKTGEFQKSNIANRPRRCLESFQITTLIHIPDNTPSFRLYHARNAPTF